MQRGNPPPLKVERPMRKRVWRARRAVKTKTQQPHGCEDFGKRHNAAIRTLFRIGGGLDVERNLRLSPQFAAQRPLDCGGDAVGLNYGNARIDYYVSLDND